MHSLSIVLFFKLIWNFCLTTDRYLKSIPITLNRSHPLSANQHHKHTIRTYDADKHGSLISCWSSMSCPQSHNSSINNSCAISWTGLFNQSEEDFAQCVWYKSKVLGVSTTGMSSICFLKSITRYSYAYRCFLKSITNWAKSIQLYTIIDLKNNSL